jgi:CubicO group peptidase (beta-lactamase class C family)
MAEREQTLPAELDRGLRRTVAQRQADWRAPALIAGVVRDGALTWSFGLGTPDVTRRDEPPGANTAFAIGSITKTFTATLVLQLRDEGKLALDDPLGAHLPGGKHAGITLRSLVSHASGLQREPVGAVWDDLRMPSIEAVVARLDDAEQVLPARLRWHYSNLAFALLGEVVARVDGRDWAQALQVRLLDPLGMTRTGLDPAEPRALGYYTDPFADRVHPEKWVDMAAFSAAGGLWSTIEDLARWAAFLADGADGVLSADTLGEMSRPEIMADLQRWTLAWGLGLQLFRRGERVLAGHGGAMPGFLAGIAVRRAERVGAIVLANTTAGAAPSELAAELVCEVLDADPPMPQPWQPGPPVPDELAPLVGRWWSEGSPFAFSVRNGALEARLESAPATTPPAVFERVSAGVYRTVSGREQGEALRIERDALGAVHRLFWASYPFTREPQTFG